MDIGLGFIVGGFLFLIVFIIFMFKTGFTQLKKLKDHIEARKGWNQDFPKTIEITEPKLEEVTEKFETIQTGKGTRKPNGVCVGIRRGKNIFLYAVKADELKAKVEGTTRVLAEECYYISGLHKIGKVDLRTPLPFYTLENDKLNSFDFVTVDDADTPDLSVKAVSRLVDSAFIEGIMGSLNVSFTQALLYGSIGVCVYMLIGFVVQIIVAGLT